MMSSLKRHMASAMPGPKVCCNRFDFAFDAAARMFVLRGELDDGHHHRDDEIAAEDNAQQARGDRAGVI